MVVTEQDACDVGYNLIFMQLLYVSLYIALTDKM